MQSCMSATEGGRTENPAVAGKVLVLESAWSTGEVQSPEARHTCSARDDAPSSM